MCLRACVCILCSSWQLAQRTPNLFVIFLLVFIPGVNFSSISLTFHLKFFSWLPTVDVSLRDDLILYTSYKKSLKCGQQRGQKQQITIYDHFMAPVVGKLIDPLVFQG